MFYAAFHIRICIVEAFHFNFHFHHTSLISSLITLLHFSCSVQEKCNKYCCACDVTSLSQEPVGDLSQFALKLFEEVVESTKLVLSQAERLGPDFEGKIVFAYTVPFFSSRSR